MEILQDSISRDSAYGALMPVTASNYGYKIRDAVLIVILMQKIYKLQY